MEQIEESILPERKVVYAAFSGRLVAVVVDGLVLSIPFMIIVVNFKDRPILANSIIIIIAWLYDAIQISSSRQATIGKKMINIKITDLKGDRINFLQATARHFAKILSGVILSLGYFMMLWDEKCQTLHDKIAGTLAVCG